MNLKKTGIAIAMAAMMMSGAAMAGYGGGADYLSDNTLEIGAGNDNNNNGGGNDNNQYTSNDGNDNNDNNNNGAGNDHNKYTSNNGDDNNKIGGGDDNNKEWNDSANVGNGDDNNKEWNHSANNTATNTMTNSQNIIDASHNLSFEVDMVLAKSDLDGHITHTNVEYGESAKSGYHPRGGCNTCAGAGVEVNNTNTMTGFNNAAGITTVGQSAGANSMVQQSVVTNATVQTN